MSESGLARLVECNFAVIGCVHQLLGLALEMQIAPLSLAHGYGDFEHFWRASLHAAVHDEVRAELKTTGQHCHAVTNQVFRESESMQCKCVQPIERILHAHARRLEPG